MWCAWSCWTARKLQCADPRYASARALCWLVSSTRLLGAKALKKCEEEGEHSDSDNEDGDVFVDQPAYAFVKLMDNLRLRAIAPAGATLPLPIIPADQKKPFASVVQYYFPGAEGLFIAKFDSAILTDEAHEGVIKLWIKEGSVELSLLYRGSHDGFEASAFHRQCDGKGATLTLVKTTEGHVCGGFTDQSWDSTSGSVSSADAFLFSLTPAPEKFSLLVDKRETAMFCSVSTGAVFGHGPDLRISDRCNKPKSCRSELGKAYCRKGFKRTFLTGRSPFAVVEVEVFSVL